MSKDVKAAAVKTLQGMTLNLTTLDGLKIDGAAVTAADIVADNGVIHAIDTVLIRPLLLAK